MTPDEQKAAREAEELKLAREIFADPETGPQFRALIAKKRPQAVSAMPDVLVSQAVAPALARVAEKEKALDARLAEMDQSKARAAARQAVIESGLVAAHEIPAVEEIMTKELVGTHAAAAEIHNARKQVAVPVSQGGGRLGIPGYHGAGGDEFKGLVEDRQRWASEKAHEMVNDFRSGRGNKWAAFA